MILRSISSLNLALLLRDLVFPKVLIKVYSKDYNCIIALLLVAVNAITNKITTVETDIIANTIASTISILYDKSFNTDVIVFIRILTSHLNLSTRVCPV